MKPNSNPLLLALLITMAARSIALVTHYFGHDTEGHALTNAPLNILLVALPYHLNALLLLGGLLLVLWKFSGRARPFVTAAGMLVFAMALLIGQADFGLQRFLGSRLTPGVLETYLSPALFSPELYGPVLFDPVYLVIALALIFIPWILMLVVAWRTRGGAPALRWRTLAIVFIAAALCRIPVIIAYGHQRDALQPTEYLYYDLLRHGDPTPTLPDEKAAIARLRAALDPAGVATWPNEAFPLVRAGGPASRYPSAPAAGREPPDIIVFFIESLRGMSVGYGDGPKRTQPSPTPNLDQLAAGAVVFPRHLSNGNPSPRGFFSFNAGAWCHRDKFIISGFTSTTFDSLPLRLRSAGYHTVALWGSNPSFDNQLFWGRKWYEDLEYGLPEDKLFWLRALGDDLLMDRFLGVLDKHDRASPARPLFAFIATTGTHEPYTQGNYAHSATGGVPPELSNEPDAQVRYDACLRFLDTQIGRVIAELEKRPRSRNTVIIVTGDHADLTNEQVDILQRGLPVDSVVWTSLLMKGPAELIGPPRREVYPTTHADVLPTVLGMIGDQKPVVTLGTNLFADQPPGSTRLAISGSGRGFRLDRDGWMLLVDARNPDLFYTARSFEAAPAYRTTLDGTPFLKEDPQRLWEHFQVWSRLVETDRVWPAQPATPRTGNE